MSATNIERPILHYAFRLKKGEEGDTLQLYEDFKNTYFCSYATQVLPYVIHKHEYVYDMYGTEGGGTPYHNSDLLKETRIAKSPLSGALGGWTVELNYGNTSEVSTESYSALLAALVKNPLPNSYYFLPFSARKQSVAQDATVSDLSVSYFALKFSFEKNEIRRFLVNKKVERYASIGFRLPDDKSEFDSFEDFFNSFCNIQTSTHLSYYFKRIKKDEIVIEETEPLGGLASVNIDEQKTLNIPEAYDNSMQNSQSLGENQRVVFSQVLNFEDFSWDKCVKLEPLVLQSR